MANIEDLNNEVIKYFEKVYNSNNFYKLSGEDFKKYYIEIVLAIKNNFISSVDAIKYLLILKDAIVITIKRDDEINYLKTKSDLNEIISDILNDVAKNR